MRILLAALAATASLALPAKADYRIDLSERYDPTILWYEAPNTTTAGAARIRIVFDGHRGAAALTPNQYWEYTRIYKKSLASFAYRMPMSQAVPQARHVAFRELVRLHPNLRVSGFDLAPLRPERLTPSW